MSILNTCERMSTQLLTIIPTFSGCISVLKIIKWGGKIQQVIPENCELIFSFNNRSFNSRSVTKWQVFEWNRCTQLRMSAPLPRTMHTVVPSANWKLCTQKPLLRCLPHLMSMETRRPSQGWKWEKTFNNWNVCQFNGNNHLQVIIN